MDKRIAALFPGAIALSTRNAARVLNKQPQTLRRWACFQSAPIQPIRLNGRLHWRVEDLERLLGLDAGALA